MRNATDYKKEKLYFLLQLSIRIIKVTEESLISETGIILARRATRPANCHAGWIVGVYHGTHYAIGISKDEVRSCTGQV